MNGDSINSDRLDTRKNLRKRYSFDRVRGDRFWGLLVVFSALSVGGILGLLTCPQTKVMFF